MTGHCVEDDRQGGRGCRDGNNGIGYLIKTVIFLIGEDHNSCFMGFENSHIFDDVLRHRPRITGRANQNQRLGGKINMFLIFHDIRRNGFIAEFTELDSYFIGCRLIGTAAHNRPVAFVDGFLRRSGYHFTTLKELCHPLRRGFQIA